MQLSVPTIQVVILANFSALAIVWFYVARSYPNLNAAKFWRASMCVAAAGAATASLRGIVHPLFPVILGNGLMILAIPPRQAAGERCLSGLFPSRRAAGADPVHQA